MFPIPKRKQIINKNIQKKYVEYLKTKYFLYYQLTLPQN